jgi:hypothetical protein
MCDALYINYMAYGIWGESIRLYPGSIDIVCSTITYANAWGFTT